MGIERILTREFFNTKIRDPDPTKTEIYYEINPIIKLKPTNYFRITITGWWSWSGVTALSPNYPQLLMGLRFNGENHKCMSQIGDGQITNDLYYTVMNDMRQKTQDGKPEPGNQFNVLSVEPIQFYLDEFPTNLISFYKALMGNIADPDTTLFNTMNYGFTLKLEELSKDTPYDYLPKIKQIYQQTFCEAVPSGGYNLTKFYFNSYIKKNYKNKWLVSIINQTANSVSAGVLNFINMLRLIIPETNSSWIINDKQNLYKININMTLGSNGADGTQDNVLVAWEYEDGTYSPYEIIAEAPVFGSTINVTIYPPNPEGEDMPQIVGARITISGTDGIKIDEIFVNGVQSDNIGKITSPDEYRDYPLTLTQSIDYLENSINGGNYGVRQYGNFIAQGKQPFPNQFLMNDITFSPFYGNIMRYNPNTGLFAASAKFYGFTLQIEEMEVE